MLCNKCGVEMAPGSAFCASCGNPVNLATERANAAVATGGLRTNVAGALCYLGGFVTGILFLVLDPYRHDHFVRFHAFQSIYYSVAWIAVYIALGTVESLLPWSAWHFFSMLSTFMSLALLCIALWLMYRAYNHERFKLPVIGNLAEKQA